MKKVSAFIIAFTLIAIVLIMTTACGEYTPSAATETPTFEKQSQENEANVSDLINRYELPKLTRSQDFDNVKQRLEYLNQANNIGYLYLLSDNGQLVKEVQVSGKVTSLNTYITPMEEIKKVEDRYYSSMTGVSYDSEYLTIQAPDLDGTYGENVNGIFWFTPDGVYQEWTGLYLFSAERLSFTTQPLLIETMSN